MSFDLRQDLTAEFKMTLDRATDRWTVVCTGILDAREAANIVQPELMRLHEALMAENVPLVRLDISAVEYINSSGLKAFMVWFLAAANSKPATYRIEVLFDSEVSWQQLSLQPMERLAPKTVQLTPKSSA